MIKSVVREHHWTPIEIDNMFIDSIDYDGIEFWYNDGIEVSKELNKKKKT